MIKAIVAVDKNWGIGKNNGLLFNLQADMQQFRTKTMNKIVVCGENTLRSFPKQKPLKGRSTIVLCPEGHEYADCICVHDFEQLVKMVKVLSITNTVWVIGGGMMYKSMLPYCDEVFVTKVEAADKDATVFFPNLDESPDFIITSMTEKDDILEENGTKFSFVTYSRLQPEREMVIHDD